MQKPQAIRQFDLLYLGGLAISIVSSALNMGAMRQAVAQAGQQMPGFIAPTVIATFAIGTLLVLLLWYFTSVRHSNVAKWILVVFVILGLGAALMALNRPAATAGLQLPQPSILVTALGILAYLAQAWATTRLFTAEGKAWFAPSPNASGYPPQGSFPPPPYPPQR